MGARNGLWRGCAGSHTNGSGSHMNANDRRSHKEIPSSGRRRAFGRRDGLHRNPDEPLSSPPSHRLRPAVALRHARSAGADRRARLPAFFRVFRRVHAGCPRPRRATARHHRHRHRRQAGARPRIAARQPLGVRRRHARKPGRRRPGGPAAHHARPDVPAVRPGGRQCGRDARPVGQLLFVLDFDPAGGGRRAHADGAGLRRPVAGYRPRRSVARPAIGALWPQRGSRRHQRPHPPAGRQPARQRLHHRGQPRPAHAALRPERADRRRHALRQRGRRLARPGRLHRQHLHRPARGRPRAAHRQAGAALDAVGAHRRHLALCADQLPRRRRAVGLAHGATRHRGVRHAGLEPVHRPQRFAVAAPRPGRRPAPDVGDGLERPARPRAAGHRFPARRSAAHRPRPSFPQSVAGAAAGRRAGPRPLAGGVVRRRRRP